MDVKGKNGIVVFVNVISFYFSNYWIFGGGVY